MNPVAPLLAFVAVFLAFVTTYVLTRKTTVAAEPARISTIDGLRGYLAFFVFLHHSVIWYFYLHTGQWKLPPSNLYTHLGQSSVAFFFMITGFLFFSKILSGRSKPIDWGKLYVSRVLRLTPLYLVAMVALLAIVAVLSKGVRVESIAQLAREVSIWLGFTILGAPNINGVESTFVIISGVTWSLPYEWLFYFTLPLLALLVKARVPYYYVALALLAIAAFFLAFDKMNSLIIFPIGMGCALLARIDRIRRFARTSWASLIAIGATFAAVNFYGSAHGIVPLVLLSITFALIACGNSLFGLLTNATSRALGETAYSIYLLHGLVLFVTFNFVIGLPAAKAMTASMHWLTVLLLAPVVVVISHVTYQLIELPAMQSTGRVTAWLRRSGVLPGYTAT